MRSRRLGSLKARPTTRRRRRDAGTIPRPPFWKHSSGLSPKHSSCTKVIPPDFLRPPTPHTSIQAHSHRTAATMGGGDGGLIDRDKVRAVCRAGVKF